MNDFARIQQSYSRLMPLIEFVRKISLDTLADFQPDLTAAQHGPALMHCINTALTVCVCESLMESEGV